HRSRLHRPRPADQDRGLLPRPSRRADDLGRASARPDGPRRSPCIVSAERRYPRRHSRAHHGRAVQRPGRFGESLRHLQRRGGGMAGIEDKKVAQMGTFNGNPLTVAASKVTLLEILDANAYAHFDALAETLQGGLDEAIGRYELPFHVITLAARGGVTYRAR